MEKYATYRQSRTPQSLIFLLFISTGINYVVCETFIIVPSSESSCPDLEICYTLNQYASNSNLSSGLDNITLELQPGIHSLNVPLIVSDISSFTMRGIDATLQCVKKFNFSYTEDVTLGGISFINCGGRSSIFENHVVVVSNFILECSSFETDQPFYIESTSNVNIVNSTFTNSPRGVLAISGYHTEILISNCIFSDNVQASSSSIGVIFARGGSSSVTIENSVFKNNRMNEDHTSGAFQGRGETLTVINSTFVGNSGGRLGAGAIHAGYKSVTISSSFFNDNIGSDSGAVSSTRSNSVTVINRCMFFNNTNSKGSLSGGAVHVSADESSITIHESIFRSNNGTNGGGALGFIMDNSSISLNNSTFSDNTGGRFGGGGAIDILASNVSLIVKHSNFYTNNIEGDGGALRLRGDIRMVSINESTFQGNSAFHDGVLSVFNSQQLNDAKFVISNSVFINNINNNALGCGVLSVTAFTSNQEHTLHRRTVQISKSVFKSNNQSRPGVLRSGIICLSNTNASILSSNFSRNGATSLIAAQSRVIVDGSVFNENSVEGDGGAVYGHRNFVGLFNQTVFTNNRARGSGGAMYLSDSQVTIYDSTIGYNEAGIRGGAVAIDGGMLTIEDSNVYNNTAKLGSVVSACDGADVNVNISEHLFVSVDRYRTPGENCLLYSTKLNSSAISYTKVSLISFIIFILSSMVTIS